MNSNRETPQGRRVVGPGFHARVRDVVRDVPPGRVATYGDVAAALGRRSVARHVGYALSALHTEEEVPWFRIVNARGEVSCRDDGRPSLDQIRLLRAEGIQVSDAGRIAGFKNARLAAEELPPR